MFNVSKLFRTMCEELVIRLNDQRFVYFVDFDYLMDASRGYNFGNLTPDYGKFLRHGLRAMKYTTEECTNNYCFDHNSVLDSLCLLCERICERLLQERPCNYETKLTWFRRMPDSPALDFQEALQRVLFVNQIIWQSNHRLVGLGSMDSLLAEYLSPDLSIENQPGDGVMTIIKDFYHILHENYREKSSVLLGDTGQIIVLGTSNAEGGYEYNELTLFFIRALMETRLPDPKILLRVNKNTPRRLLELALECMATGIGAPLLANDDVILPQLIKFGVSNEDALNYTVSACWEPLIGGKDTSQNNVTTINFMRCLNNLFMREPLAQIFTFEQFKERFFKYLAWNLNAVKRVAGMQRMQYDPVLSAFIGGCFEHKKDVSHSGAYYHDIGITSVAMANTVKALLNIQESVFVKKETSLLSIKKMIVTDFSEDEGWVAKLKQRSSEYEGDDQEIIKLTKEIMGFVSDETRDFRTYMGGRIKVGLSAPSYIGAAKDFPASFDGRRENEPFSVHISNEDVKSYTEVINFAAALDYGDNRFNGNVVDLMIAPDFINNNFQKFVDFIFLSIEKGFFQMQMNVVSSKTLIEAKENPEKYQGLIVRVWGFSAYFNDLPAEYKDVLIGRALKNERRAG